MNASTMMRAMVLALAVAAVPLVGCDEGRVLKGLLLAPDAAPEDPSVPEIPVEPDAGPPDAGAPDAGAPDEGPRRDPGVQDDYAAMCRHYCQTLQQTLLYACLESDGPSAGCDSRFEGTAQQCFDLRCVPRKVQPYLCLVQCDSLARFYQPACARSDLAGAPVCAVPAGEHDRLCREGCAAAGAP